MKKIIIIISLSIIMLTNISVARLIRVTKQKQIDKSLNNSSRPDMIITPFTGQNLNAGNSLWEAFYLQNQLPSGVTNLTTEFPQYYFDYQVASVKNIPLIAGIQLKDGIVLCTGNATDIKGPNEKTSMTGGLGTGVSDADVLNATNGTLIYDTPIFIIKFTTDATVEGFTFTFSFGTEEYPEFVSSKFNDVFICLLDGKNICFDSEGNLISLNSTLFNIDNNDQSGTSPINLEWDGFTYVLKVSERLTQGDHTLKFAVADVADNKVDAGVFLSDFKFEYETESMIPQVNIIEPETLTVSPTNTGNILVGTITNFCYFSPVSCKNISNLSQFSVNGFDIKTVANCNLQVGDIFKLKVVGTLDTLWEGKSWIVHDTAEIVVKVDGDVEWPQIESSAIYDKNGDGVGDSIAVNFEYAFPNDYIVEKANFSWGAANFSSLISNSNLNANKDKLSFRFTNNNSYYTFGETTINIQIDSSGNSSTHTKLLSDAIGPILINNALLHERLDSGPDTLVVSVSEKINVTALNDKEFYLIKDSPTGTKYILTLIAPATNPNGNNTDIKFICKDLGANAPKKGDYLQINSMGSMTDEKNNKPHPDNTPVPITLLKKDIAKISSAKIYDINANGKGDKVTVTFDKSISFDKLKSATIEYPKNSGNIITVSNNFQSISTNSINIIGFEMANINTYGIGDIEITFDSLGTNIIRTGNINDKIAPVIISATLIDSVEKTAHDELTVEFSEKIRQITADQPFKFFSRSQDIKFDAKLSYLSQTDFKAVFYIDELIGCDTIIEGDSIQCNWEISAPITDATLNSNRQINPNNNLCPINIIVVEKNIRITDASYYDTDANGRIETIILTLTGKFEDYISDIMDNLILPEYRKFRVDNYTKSNDKLIITVTQEIEENEINTAVTNKDIVIIKSEITLSNNLLLQKSSTPIKDNIAPIIMTANLIDYLTFENSLTENENNTDSLFITFSENIDNIIEKLPFKFINKNDKDYGAEITLLKINDQSAVFKVDKVLDNADSIADGDKIWINWNTDDNISDLVLNNQNNRDNIKRVINVTQVKIPLKITWVAKATLLDKDGSDSYQNERIMRITLQPKNNDIELLTEFDRIEANLKIIDPVGNIILNYTEMEFNKQFGIALYKWDGKNSYGRTVGSGSYLVLIEGRRYFNFATLGIEKNVDLIRPIKLIVGVKE